MRERFVAKITDHTFQPRVKHFRGLPPELTHGEDHRQLLERALLLVIEEVKNGALLYRFTGGGKCVGDTWHPTVLEAKEQAIFEFDSFVSEWKPVPEEIADPVTFGLAN